MIKKILQQQGESVIGRLRESFASNNVNASGKLSATLEADVEESSQLVRLVVDAEGYVFTSEDGRGPTRNSGDGSLVTRIRQWMDDKGGFSGTDQQKNSIAYAITTNIHKKGTRLFRRGGNSGVLSDVINDSLLSELENEIADGVEQTVFEAIGNAGKNGSIQI